MGRFSTPRRVLAGALLSCLVAPAALFGCVDLFHSTDFGSCDTDAADGGCAEAGASPSDAGKPKDGATDTTKPSDAVAGDATVDQTSPVSDAGDATVDQGSPGSDAGADTQSPSDVAQPDTNPPPVDAGTDFCDWSSAEAQAHATHACAWLGACAGNTDLNEFGTCYPMALLAYDCNLNPNQQVRGALHAYWDQLWQAKSCPAVLEAVFGGAVPGCTTSPTGCGDGLPGAASSLSNVVALCGADGGFASAVHCDMRGYTCSAGACTNGGAPCTAAGTGSCVGNVFHACQSVESDAGLTKVTRDVGRDCTNFGAGACVANSVTGAAGCAPNDPGAACTPSTQATCAGANAVMGCATGQAETINCGAYPTMNNCSVGSGWVASSSDLPSGCYVPAANGYPQASNKCTSVAAFSVYSGPVGNVLVPCADAGLGNCAENTTAVHYPFCLP